VILVVGRPALGADDRPDGSAARVALAAVEAGARVELVGSVGDDAAGDAVAVALGRAGIGHAALLRDPAGTTRVAGEADAASLPRLDAHDLDLALRYLPDCRVLVVTEPLPPEVMAVVVEAAQYHQAALVVVVSEGTDEPVGLPATATVLAAPADDGAVFAALVGRYAAALAAGQVAADAWATALADAEWEEAGAE
jgi:ribokinase